MPKDEGQVCPFSNKIAFWDLSVVAACFNKRVEVGSLVALLGKLSALATAQD